MPPTTLSPAQVHALFDILTHHEIYAEIQSFQSPNAIHEYGSPFKKEPGVAPTSPLLQILLNKFALPLPGLKSVPKEFWEEKVQTIVEKLGAAELSQSYDKGSLGARKTLATACSAILEYVARGCLGGYPKHSVDSKREYDLSKAEDVLQGWDDFIQQMIYGDMIDELVDKIKETDTIENQPPVVQAAHEYILVNIAAFLHHVLIESPDGQYILRIIENVHKLVPYGMARQTLRVGNAATMINGMVKLILTKLSVTAFTNWLGLSNSANDGMNLLQQITSTVMSWDVAEFQKKATKIEKMKDGPSKQHLDAIKAHLQKSREEHDSCRKASQDAPMSIVSVILASESIGEPLSDEQHRLAQDYFSLLLSIRDREELSNIFCKSYPDYLTQAIRDGVSAYDPIIRSIHNAYDLSGGLSDFENFLNDLIKISKPSKRSSSSNGGIKSRSNSANRSRSNSANPPTVDDFLALIKRHQGAAHRFLHQIAKNGPEMTAMYQKYLHQAASEFRAIHTDGVAKRDMSVSTDGAGEMTDTLKSLFDKLSEKEQRSIMPTLDEHSAYLANLAASSHARMKSIIANNGEKSYGPGMYLAKWKAMLDSTVITPATPNGPLRSGKDPDVNGSSQMTLSANGSGRFTMKRPVSRDGLPQAPNIDEVVKLLHTQFRAALVKRTKQ